MSGEPLGLD